MVFKHLTVFGDSLSDNGNLYKYSFHMVPKSPPYFKGHFSNGPIWFEGVKNAYWKSDLNATTDVSSVGDYAVGGAGAIFSDKEVLPYTLWSELTDYLIRDNGTNIDSTLFVVWIGANNYVRGPENVEELTTDVVAGIEKGINRLLKHGATMITIGNLPDLGVMPESERYGTKDLMHELTLIHNEKLFQMYQSLQQSHPNVHFIYMDVFALFNDALASPSAYGLSDMEHPCYEGGFFFSAQLRGLMGNALESQPTVSDATLKAYMLKKSASQSNRFSAKTADAYLGNTVLREAILNGYYADNKKHQLITAADGDSSCTGYLFWDHLHPTTFVHQHIAKLFIDTVKEAGIVPAP